MAEVQTQAQGAFAREHHVGVLLQQVPGELYGVLEAGHLDDRPRPAVAGHDARVEARDPVRLQVAARAGVQDGLVLQHAHGLASRLDRGAALLQHREARVGRARAGRLRGAFLGRGHVAAAAVDHENGTR